RSATTCPTTPPCRACGRSSRRSPRSPAATLKSPRCNRTLRGRSSRIVRSGEGGAFCRCRATARARGTGQDMLKIPMTVEGFSRLEEELKHLKGVERPAVIRAIAEAREHGDLSENAEYHAARERQSFIEGRIRELEGVIGRSEVIDASRLSGPIKFGATVVLLDEDSEEEKTYQIVGEQEANIED